MELGESCTGEAHADALVARLLTIAEHGTDADALRAIEAMLARRQCCGKQSLAEFRWRSWLWGVVEDEVRRDQPLASTRRAEGRPVIRLTEPKA
jgi:hypothetical protein